MPPCRPPFPPLQGADGSAAAGGEQGGGGGLQGSGSSGALLEDLSPPYAIMEHAPLALLTNGVLTALNELRHCAMLGLAKPAAGCAAGGGGAWGQQGNLEPTACLLSCSTTCATA